MWYSLDAVPGLWASCVRVVICYDDGGVRCVNKNSFLSENSVLNVSKGDD